MRIAITAPVCLTALCAGLSAQSTFGTVQGSVLDSSGAAVAGASLTLTEIDKGTVRNSVSNDIGLYQFLNVPRGRYSLTAKKPGFAAARAHDLILNARQSLRVDLTLQIAARTDIALVAASVPLVNSENGTISDTKSSEQIRRLPINSRALTASPLPAIMIFPGVQEDDRGQISIAGGMPAQTEFTVDGISTLNAAGGGAIGLDPRFRSSDVISPEAISEFRVSSVGNKAEFGQVNDVTLVTRSGTNTSHGSLLWYHQNAALDAKTYGALQKQHKVFNAFGATFSGPIMLPHLYRGTNRTFFFVDYEGDRKPNTVLQQFSVPTAAMRAGDLNGAPGGPAVDPLTGAPFPGNVIPDNRINSVARSLLTNYIPLPNYPGVSQNYRRLTREDTNADLFNVRLDQMIGSRQQLYGRWSFNSAEYADVAGLGILPPGRLPTRSDSLVVAHTFAIQPNMSNEARFGVTHLRQDEVYPLEGKQVVGTLGLQGLDLSNVGSSGGFPYFDFSDGTGFDYAYKGRDTHLRSATWQYADALSWAKGAHSLKFGAEARRASYSTVPHGGDGADDFGGFEFDSGVFSGNAFADLLLGLPAYTYYAKLGPEIAEQATHYSFFAQDDWKLTNRFTLNYGLRWELHPPMSEAHGNITNFQAATGSVVIPDHTLPPAPGFLAAINACPGTTSATPCTKVLSASQAGLPQTLRKTYYGDWDPRLAFAWQPFSSIKTLVRGGAGVYTQLMLGGVAQELTNIHTSDVRDFSNQGSDGAPQFTLPQISPGGLGIIGAESFFDGTDPNFKDPRVYQWDLTIERELPASNVVRASYIGSHATGMPVRVNLNQVPASTTPLRLQTLPYPNWFDVVSLENLGFYSYEGLQLEASHRFRRDFFFQASYVYSKNIGALGDPPPQPAVFSPEYYSPLLTDRYNPRYDRGNLPGARRQRFLLTGLFPLPFGKNRRYGANWGVLLDMIAGGWELSTVTMIETGPYLTPTMAFALDRSNTGLGARGGLARPDRIANGNIDDRTGDLYWDRSAFQPPPLGAGRFGNAGAGILEGPGTVAIAAGVAKNLYATERVRLRLEATFTNLPNHPNFLPPNPNISVPSFGIVTTVQSAENSGNRSGQVGVRADF